MNYRGIIKGFSRFYASPDENCGKALERLIKQIYGRKSENADVEKMEKLLRYALGQAESEGYVCCDGKIYKGRFTFISVMSAAEIIENRVYGERKRVSAALRILLSPVSAIRALFLDSEGKYRLLYRIFRSLGAVEAGIDIGKDFPLIYGGFRQYYGIDLLKDKVEWRQFRFLLRSMPKSAALYGKENAAVMPFEEGIDRLFRQLAV